MPNKLKPGRWMMLEGKELEYLYEEAGLKTKTTKRGNVEKAPAVKDVEVEKAPKSKWPDKPAKAAKKAAPRSRKADDQPAKRGPRIRGRNDR